MRKRGLQFKVSARVQKCEFSKFVISRRSDKAFQELSFQKKFHKKYCFSAKLLDVEVYDNALRNKSHGIVVSFYHAIHSLDDPRLVRMPSKKRGGRVRFRLQPQRGRSRKNRLTRIGLKN